MGEDETPTETGIIGYVGPESEQITPDVEQEATTGLSPIGITPPPESRIEALQNLNLTGNLDQDTHAFLEASGRTTLAENLGNYPSISNIRMLSFIQRNRERLTTGDTATFVTKVSPDDPQRPDAKVLLRELPRAEISALTRVLEASHVDPRFIRFQGNSSTSRFRDLENSSASRFRDLFEADPTLKGGAETANRVFELSGILTEIRTRFDTYSDEILDLETQLDLAMAELSIKGELFQSLDPNLAERGFFKVKADYERMASKTKEHLEHLFLQIQSIRDSLAEKTFANKNRANQPGYGKAIQEASEQYYPIVEQALRSYREMADGLTEEINSLEI